MLIYLQAIEREDDRAKFEKLYLNYHDLMIYAAMKILHNQQDAEDAVHQAFLTLIDNLDKVKDTTSRETKSYLVVIAEHKAIDMLRAKKKILDLDYDEAAEGLEVSPPGDNPLAHAMAKLPARYREVLLLRYRNGYSNAELGAILRIKPESVQRLVFRAKEALQKILDEEGIEV